MLIMEHIEHDIPTHSLVHLLTIADAQMEIVEVRIPPKSAAVGRKVKDLSLPASTTLSLLIRRQQRPQVPTPETVLQAGDQVVAVTLPELEEALKLALTETGG
jgi:trk system potassium uptake protein TrkA